MRMNDLEDILEHARSNNAKYCLTGALVYVDGVFLQILEGDAEVVKELMAKISRDVRHETVTVLKQGEIPAPAFIDWRMAYISATAEQVAKWAGLSSTTTMSDAMTGIRHDPQKATQVAHSILAVLAHETDAGPKAE